MSVVTSFPPDETFDLPNEVLAGKNIDISHGNMQFKSRKGDIVVPYQTIIGRFHHALSNYIEEITLSDDDFMKYYQKPRLLSIDRYGTPELWSGLLYINNIVSVSRFTKQTLKVFTTDIIEAIEEILTIYSDDLYRNKLEVYPE